MGGDMTLLSILGIGGQGAKRMPTVLTGATSSLTALHRSRDTGHVHEHTWLVTVWVSGLPNAVDLKEKLDSVLSCFSGKCLPDRLAWAEDLAPEIAREMACMWDSYSVVRVEIVRPKEGLLAEWRKLK